MLIRFLNDLQKVLQTEIAEKVTLQGEKSDPPQLVNPYVSILSLPHKNFAPLDYQIPYILIGFDNGTDDTEEHTVDIIINFATYGSQYIKEDGILQNKPNNSGYIDLINIIEKTKNLIKNKVFLSDIGIATGSVKYGIYDLEQQGNYWFGYLLFTAELPSSQYVNDREESGYGDIL